MQSLQNELVCCSRWCPQHVLLECLDWLCLSVLVPRWQERGVGLLLNEEHIHHMIWSDNIWLIGKDEKEGMDMRSEEVKEGRQ